MARNHSTSRTNACSPDARQFLLPWSPAGQTAPAHMPDSCGAGSQEEINDPTAPSYDTCVSPRSPAPMADPYPPMPNQLKRRVRSLSLRAHVERLLKDRGIPYVNVDEAKRALFACAKLRAFHFVAYRKDGPNWLIFAAKVDRPARDTMAEWERVFGDGFKAVLASLAKSERADIRFRSLDGQLLSFESPATQAKDAAQPPRSRSESNCSRPTRQIAAEAVLVDEPRCQIRSFTPVRCRIEVRLAEEATGRSVSRSALH